VTFDYQIINIASESLNSTIVLKIAKFANEVLCGEGSTTDGLVITHGTDTIEETAMLRKSRLNRMSLRYTWSDS